VTPGRERGRETAASFALQCMALAMRFLLLQVPVLAVAGLAAVAAMYAFRASGRGASAVANTVVVLLELALVITFARGFRRLASREAAAAAAEPTSLPPGETAQDADLERFEWGMVGASAIVTVVSLVLNGSRPGWAVAVGVVDALGAFLLLVGAVAATTHDRQWHARAYLASLLLAASAAWSFVHR
jgi:hypothetical protein